MPKFDEWCSTGAHSLSISCFEFGLFCQKYCPDSADQLESLSERLKVGLLRNMDEMDLILRRLKVGPCLDDVLAVLVQWSFRQEHRLRKTHSAPECCQCLLVRNDLAQLPKIPRLAEPRHAALLLEEPSRQFPEMRKIKIVEVLTTFAS